MLTPFRTALAGWLIVAWATVLPAQQPVTVTSSALPSGAATAAKQPALGTAASPATDVITVQGIALGTPVRTEFASTPTIDVGNGSTTETDDDEVPSGATGVAQTISVNYAYNGTVNKRLRADPCAVNAKLYLPISQTTSTQLITGTASKKLYLCSLYVVATGAEAISFVAGTGSVCATNTVAVIGGTTAVAGLGLAANGVLPMGDGGFSLAATTVNADNLCLFQDGSDRLGGVLTYVVQ